MYVFIYLFFPPCFFSIGGGGEGAHRVVYVVADVFTTALQSVVGGDGSEWVSE